jgi:WD40 repeat protein
MAWTSRIALALLCSLEAAAAAQSPPPASRPLTDALGDPLPAGAIMRLGSVRWRPGGSIQHLVFAPDGARLASWHEEHYTTAALTIWDVATGRELRRVEMPDLRIFSWAWLSDGRGISVVGTSEGSYVWEFSDDKAAPPHRPATGHRGFKVAIPAPDNEDFSCFAVSPDGKYLAGGKSGEHSNKQRDVVLWELATQRKVSDLPKPRRLAACPTNCNQLFFTPDSRKLVAMCPTERQKDGRFKEYLVAVFDTATGKELRRFTSPAPLQQGSRLSHALSTKYLALGLEDEQGTVLLWDLATKQDRRLATGHRTKSQFSGYGVPALAFTADGATLIRAGRDGDVKTWDVAAGKELLAIENAYPGWIETLAVTRDGKRLACAGQNGIIRHWDLTTGNELDTQPGHGSRVAGITVTADGTTAVTSGADYHLRIWDLTSGRERRAIALPPGKAPWPRPLIAPDGRTIVASLAEQIKAWSLADGKEVHLPNLPADFKTGKATFPRDGKTLLAFHDDTVTLLDWPSGKLHCRFTLPEPALKPGETRCDAADLSADGRWLATVASRYWFREARGMRFTSAADGVLDLWNAKTGQRLHRLIDGRSALGHALFTADGDLLVDRGGTLHPLGGSDEVALKGEFHLIDPLTGRLKQSFESAPLLEGALRRYNSALGIAPDGRSIFCAGNDGVIHIYETATGKIRRSLSRHRNYVTSLATTADGRRLLTASYDLTALVWDISLIGFSPKGVPVPTPDEEANLWDKLLERDAKTPYEAMTTLAVHPLRAVAFIRAQIKPVATSPDDATLDRLVAELDDEKFAVRERATRELDRLGEAAVSGMRARLAKSPPLETHRRIVRFLDKHDPALPTPAHLQEIRALELLEQLNSAESRTALTELAQGAANARLTRAAAASLARLKALEVNFGK